MKRPCFSFSRPEVVPNYIYSSPGSHGVFFRSLISSQSSISNGPLCVIEDDSSSIYDSPFQRWVDRACGYHFRKDSLDDQSCRYYFQHDFFPPTHIHEFHFMIVIPILWDN
jgi:hypothetical protein